MASEVFNLAILLSLRDAASGGLDRFGAKLRGLGKDGQVAVDQLDKIRANLNRDLAIGGVGIAGLGLLKKGVEEAGNYEDSILRMRQAFQENTKYSSSSAAQQETQFRQLTALATELGGQLQGDTSVYANIFTAMNKSGIDAQATLNGAGRAAAYLANVMGGINNGQAPQIAEDLGSFGKMFDLKGDDYMKAVNMFAAINDRFNLSSGNLVEASKYFFSTAKGAMGLQGLEGATETAKLLAFSKRYAGREGSEAGASLDAVLSHYNTHGVARDSLTKNTGIKLDFFTDKGDFGGVENMFRQLEKMRALNPEERQFRMHKIFGEQGARVAQAMSEQGVEGWRKISQEMSKSVDVNTQINQQMDTYNAKVEALAGSWTNFKVSAFTPLMQEAKTFVDYGSKIANSLQSFSAENQGLMKTLGIIAAYGSTAMIAYSAFKTLSTGVKLFQLAGAVSKGDGLLQYLNQTKVAANSTSTSLTSVASKTTGLKGALKGLGGVAKIGLQVVGIAAAEYAITGIISSLSEMNEKFRQAEENGKKVGQMYDDLAGRSLLYNQPGDYGGRKDLFDAQADKILEIIKMGGALEKALNPQKAEGLEKFFLMGQQKPTFNPDIAAKRWETAGVKGLQDPNILAPLLVKIRKGGGDDLNANLEQIKILESAIGKMVSGNTFKVASDLANKQMYGEKPQSVPPPKPFNQLFNQPNPFPKIQPLGQFNPFQPSQLKPQFGTPSPIKGFSESKEIPNIVGAFQKFAQPISEATQVFGGLKTAGGDWQNSMLRIKDTTDTTQQNVFKFGDSVYKTITPLEGVGTSARSASGGLDTLTGKISSFQMPTIPNFVNPTSFSPGGGQPSAIPVRGIQRGGGVKSLMVRDDDSQRTQRIQNARQLVASNSSKGNITVQYSPTNHFNGNTTANDLEESNRKQRLELGKMIVRAVQDGNQRA